MTVKVNFTLPEELFASLKTNVRQRERSSFVASALREKLASLERQRLEAELTEGYQARAGEAQAINAEWEAITLEGWPDDGQ